MSLAPQQLKHLRAARPERIIRRIALVALLAATALTPPLAARQEVPAATPPPDTGGRASLVAAEMWSLLASGRIDELHDRSTDKVRAAIGAEQLKALWAGLEAQLGTFREIIASEPLEPPGDGALGETVAVRLHCRFERGILLARVVVDGQSRLAGLWFEGTEPVPDATPSGNEEPDDVVEEDLVLKPETWALPAVLALPGGDRPGTMPGVVLVHGSGPNDHDETIGPNRPFRDIARGLARQGIAVLRYDKRTFVHRDLDLEQIDLDEVVIDDALAAIAWLRARAEVRDDAVLVLGHSLGAALAPRIAARDGQLAGAILLAANARPLPDLLLDQLEYLAGLDGSVDDDERRRISSTRELIAAIRAGSAPAGTMLLGGPAAFWAELDAIDPVATAATLDLPLLIVHGGRDYQVPPAEHELWRRGLGDRPAVELRLLAPLDHLMMAGTGPSSPSEYAVRRHVDDGLVETVARWIHATVDRPDAQAMPAGSPE